MFKAIFCLFARSKDGRLLAITSQDGYNSFLRFDEGELGTQLEVSPCPPDTPPPGLFVAFLLANTSKYIFFVINYDHYCLVVTPKVPKRPRTPTVKNGNKTNTDNVIPVCCAYFLLILVSVSKSGTTPVIFIILPAELPKMIFLLLYFCRPLL